MKKPNLPIKWKLTIWYGAMLALILVVFSSGVYIYFQNGLQKSIDAKLQSIAQVLSSSMTESHNQSVFGNFERYLENVLGRKPKGKFVQIIDTSGKIGAKMNDIETGTVPASFNSLEKALKGEIVYETIGERRPRLRMITVPIMENKESKDNKKVTGIIQVGTSLEDFDETMTKLLIILVIGIPASLFATVLLGYFMAKKTLKPVDQIRKAAVKISSTNLDERIDVKGRKDELSRLAETFNAMINRLKESFARINQFSLDVSHELKTPLTILKGETEVALRKDRDKEEYKRLLVSSLEEVDRMTKIIDDLLLLSKSDPKNVRLNLEDISLKDLIVEICLDMQIFAEKKGIDLSMGDLGDVRIMGDELKLRRMLLNIVENGIKYTQSGGKVVVSSSVDDGHVRIDVQDNGAGIAKEDINYVFDRFYQADRSRKREGGSGLGLSISKWIAEAHKGTIHVESQPMSGSLFSIKLPI